MVKSISALAITSRRTNAHAPAERQWARPSIDDVNDVHRPHLSKLQKLFPILRLIGRLESGHLSGMIITSSTESQHGTRMKSYLVLVEFANHLKACSDIFPL